MKKNENELIGKILWTNDSAIQTAEHAIKTKVLPRVQDIIGEYEQLGSLPKFSAKVWAGIIADGGQSVCRQYVLQAETDLKQFANSTLKNAIMSAVEGALKPFRQSITDAKKAANNALLGALSATVQLQLSDIRINADGQPEPDLTRITDEYTGKIGNERQAEIYQAAKEAEKALEKLRSLLEGTNSDPAIVRWIGDASGWGLFSQDIATGKLEFDPQAITGIEEPEKSKKIA